MRTGVGKMAGTDGVLAQLGARNIRNVEATGSNPVYSTKRKRRKTEGFPVKSMVVRRFRLCRRGCA